MGEFTKPLVLTTPYMHGPRVEDCQWLLSGHNRFEGLAPLKDAQRDGVYGPITAGATKRAKFWLGYPDSGINGVFGQRLYEYLRKNEWRPLPADYRERRAARLRAAAATPGLKAFNFAVTQLGYEESPFGTNCQKYGRDYGFNCVAWCFAAGTLVDMPRGMTPIETILPGERVMTASGKARRVLSVGSRRSPVMKLRVQGIDATRVSPEHPYWARRRLNKPRQQPRILGDPEWIAAGDLRANDYIGFPIPQEYGCIESVTPDLAYLIGRWVGDGYTVKGYQGRATRVIITSSFDESEGLMHAISRAGLTAHPQTARTCVQHQLQRTRELRERLAPFGTGAHHKRIPGEVFMWTREAREALLRGYVDADGHCDPRTGRTIISTVSRTLALGTAKLLRSLGYPPSVTKVMRDRTTVIEGRTVNQADSYSVSWTEDRAKNRCFEEDGYLWAPVRSIESDGETTVYNLEVEDEQTFVADGAAVHNCAIFESYCFKQTGWSKFHYAACVNIYYDALNGRNGMRRIWTPKRGDVVIYNLRGDRFAHTGFFDAWVDQDTFRDLGGNTGSRSFNNGGEVARGTRQTSQVTAYVRVGG